MKVMSGSRIPELITTTLSAGCGIALGLQSIREWTGVYQNVPVDSATMSLSVLALAIGVLIAGGAIGSDDASQP